ncbi:M3 family metallopeptidase [Butyrivibrio sp. AD3002]|uniref:M3 family metallopeptidase n=1 Tax=Butyrivibrio sp. AD3002 TaxID=1280670 RepID=UPI0003B58F5F|nr:M3 family metallopeptidase [Butyrivibrio sp. AD3002]
MKRFDEIQYERPDFDLLEAEIGQAVTAAKNGESFEEFDEVYKEYQKVVAHSATMALILNIRSYLDGTDEENNAEKAYVFGKMAVAGEQRIYEAVENSAYREAFEEKYGAFLIKKQLNEKKLYEAGEEFLIRENELVTELHKCLSELKYEYNGEMVSASQIGFKKKSPDTEVRHNARYSVEKAFAENGERFGELIGELVEVRDKLAKANGFKNYLDYENISRGRFSYGEDELQEFCDNVKKYILPVLEKSNKKLQKELGLSEFTSYDSDIFFADGNAKPLGDEKFIREKVQEMYDDMDPVLGDTFRKMNENGYVDIKSTDTRITGLAFTVGIPEMRVPFIYGNFLDDAESVNDLIHESGHAMQTMLSMDSLEPQELQDPVQDLVEIPSKSMEFISHYYAEKFFGEDADKYRKGHLTSVLDEIAGYCLFHEFETFLYGCPGASKQERIDKFNELTRQYKPGVVQMHPELLDKGAGLYRNVEAIGLPRYLISYSISDLSAIYIANEFMKDKRRGTDIFMKLGRIGGSMDYFNAISALGLKPAFSEEVIKEAAEYLQKELGLL